MTSKEADKIIGVPIMILALFFAGYCLRSIQDDMRKLTTVPAVVYTRDVEVCAPQQSDGSQFCEKLKAGSNVKNYRCDKWDYMSSDTCFQTMPVSEMLSSGTKQCKSTPTPGGGWSIDCTTTGPNSPIIDGNGNSVVINGKKAKP